MTPRAGGVDVSRLHHLTFPVADQTGAPDEYLAGPWVTSCSRRLVLTFSCSARIARHSDGSMDFGGPSIAKSHRRQTGLGLPPGGVLVGVAGACGNPSAGWRLRQAAVARVEDVVVARASEGQVPEVRRNRLARRGTTLVRRHVQPGAIRRIRRGIHERRVAAEPVEVRVIAHRNSVAVVAEDRIVPDVVFQGIADQRQTAVDLLRRLVRFVWSRARAERILSVVHHEVVLNLVPERDARRAGKRAAVAGSEVGADDDAVALALLTESAFSSDDRVPVGNRRSRTGVCHTGNPNRTDRALPPGIVIVNEILVNVHPA